MVGIHLLTSSAAEIGFRWNPDALAWVRPGLPSLSNLAGPIQHFRCVFLDAWRNRVAADLCGRKGFRGGPLLDVHGYYSSLILLMFEKEIKVCFVVSWLGVSGMVSCWVVFVIRFFLVASAVLLIMMVICSGNVPFLILLRYVKILISRTHGDG